VSGRAGQVDGGHGAGAAPGGGDRDRAASGADVEHGGAAGADLAGEHAGEQPRVGDGAEDPGKRDEPRGATRYPRVGDRETAGRAAGGEAGPAVPAGLPAASGAAELRDPDRLRAAFVHERPWTIGIEEELMLLHPDTLDLAPRAGDVLARTTGDARFRRELPAAQLEIVLPPVAGVVAARALLRAARSDLARAAAGIGVLAGAGAHPFAAPDGVLNAGERYERIAREFASVARRQLVFGLHVHVALPGPDVALATYNAVREHLPALAALGAGAPFHDGRDTGLASVRPTLSALLPRQGVPPAFASWDELVDALAWGAASGAFPDPAQWWWETRLHPRYGTLEIRVPDTQATVTDTAAIAAVCHALVAHLAQRVEAADAPPIAPSWRIAENRWSACRHGVRGVWRDVHTGASRPMADHLHGWLDELEPTARALACAPELAHARDLVDRPRDELARAVVADVGVSGLVGWLAERFTG
jgi:glutamate---cysteine ligase / carboxylate-amine ligase